MWPGSTKIAIDHAIAEPVAAAGGVAVVPGDFGWDDVGDFASLAALLAGRRRRRRRVLGDAGRSCASTPTARSSCPAAGRTVTRRSGCDDVVVVDTPDALLVTTRAHAQQVKAVVDGWRARGRDDLL